MINSKYNYLCEIGILETIWLSTNKWALACLKISSTKYEFTNHIYLLYTFKKDLALNNLPGLICHKINQSGY